MPTFEASTSIAADPERVWDTLLDTDQWPAWDDTLDHVEGALEAGAAITIHVKGQSRPFKLKVAEWQPGSRLVLRGGMPLGLFTGTRTYDLSASTTRTDIVVVERYTGPMAPIIGKQLPDLQPGFDAFVAGWREASER